MFSKAARFVQLAGVTLLVLLLSQTPSAFAASLTGEEDVMTNQIPSGSSDHQIRFVTPSGVDASSDTMTLTFDTGFTLGSVDFSDMDLFHGPTTGLETEETLAATAAAGVWGAGVSGQVITFTAPSDAAAGEISAGDIVTIRIGTNASSGTDQITNPSSGGNYTINFAGTFGDVGGVVVPIGSDHLVSVSATVPTPSLPPSPPGGGGGPGTDGAPPIISNVRVEDVTQNSANILWDTDEPADSQVRYGLDTTYASGTLFNPSLVTAHTISLSGLTPDTVYHFTVRSRDAVGNAATTGDFTFRTLPPPHPPVITNIRVVSITDSSAVVLWDTDIPATSLVEYGETAVYGRTASTPGFVTNHSVSLSGLTPATLYHFRVQSSEPGGLTSVSGDNTFTTLSDMTPPGNVFGFTATPGDELNTLDWTNPPDLDFSHVVIRARTDRYPTDPRDGRLVFIGSAEHFVDAGLVNGVTYYYGNFAYDTSGNRASGAFAQATPSSVPVPPVPPVPPPPPPGPGPGPAPGPGPGPAPTPPPGTPTPPPGAVTTTPPTPPPPGVVTTTPPTIPPVPPPVPPAGALQVFFYAGAGQIPLQPTTQGVIIAPQGRTLLALVPTTGFTSPVISGSLRVGDSLYGLTTLPGQPAIGATFVPSFDAGTVTGLVEVIFEDGTRLTREVTFDVRGGGRILEDALLGPERPLPGATVELIDPSTGSLWDGSVYGEANPVVTGEDGAYLFVVPNGEYLIRVSKEGYLSQERTVVATQNIVGIDIILPRAIPIPFIGELLEAIQTEEVKEGANIAAIIASLAILANLASGATLLSLLYYIWFLFTQPILLLGRKKRKKWGLVYSSLSKQAIDLAAVRLLDAATGRVVQTRITDKLGRFVFRAKPGLYRISAAKKDFIFPTGYLKDVKEDGKLVDIYHGENIKVKDESSIAVNIPMDPISEKKSVKRLLWQRWARKVQHIIAIFGPVVTLVSFIISPSWWMGALFVFQVVTYLLFLRLAVPKKPKGWGVIYDRRTRKPLKQAVVRIFDTKFNKLLETQITDAHGNYGFFAKDSVYFITAEKQGYEKHKSDELDLAVSDTKVVDRHIPLAKANK